MSLCDCYDEEYPDWFPQIGQQIRVNYSWRAPVVTATVLEREYRNGVYILYLDKFAHRIKYFDNCKKGGFFSECNYSVDVDIVQMNLQAA